MCSFLIYLGAQEDLALEKTTLANLDPDQPPDNHYMWAHVFVGFLFFPISILVMKHFSVNLKFTEYDVNDNKTLMINNLTIDNCSQIYA